MTLSIETHKQENDRIYSNTYNTYNTLIILIVIPQNIISNTFGFNAKLVHMVPTCNIFILNGLAWFKEYSNN